MHNRYTYQVKHTSRLYNKMIQSFQTKGTTNEVITYCKWYKKGLKTMLEMYVLEKIWRFTRQVSRDKWYT